MIGASAVRSTLAPLQNADFRRLFAGHVVSLAGDGLYFVAAMWLVYDLTGSPAYSGLAGFLTSLPGILKIAVGPLVDRTPLRCVLVASELLQGAVVLVVPLAALFGYLSVPLVLAVMPVLTLVGLLTGPAQNATLPRVVADDELSRSNSVVSFASQGVETLTQGIAGASIALIGAVALYVLNAATFAMAACLYALVRIPALDGNDADADEAAADGSGEDDDPDPEEESSYLADVREGLDLVTGSVLVHMVGAAAASVLLIGATMAVLPAFADTLGGPRMYGYLVASMTAGSLFGALVASRFEGVPLGRVATTAFTIAGICWTGAVVSPWLPARVAFFGLAWAPIGVYNVLVSTTLQVGVPDETLGRVSATIGSLTSLARPVGLLAGGVAGSVLGVRTVIGAAAGGFVCTAGYWAVVPALRELPPVAELSTGAFGIDENA